MLGNGISTLGNWLLVIAVPVHIHTVTGSPMATGLALAVQAIPALVIGPWAGVFIDRWDRHRIVTWASVAGAASVCLLLLPGLGSVYSGLVLESAVVAFLTPAARAFLPEIIQGVARSAPVLGLKSGADRATGTGDRLASANAAASMTAAVLRMAGPIAGTLAYVQGGLTLVIVLDVVSYLAAALIFASIRTPSQPPAVRRQLLRELADGAQHVASSKLMRPLILTSWTFWMANAGLSALLVPFAVRQLDGSGADIGYLITALGIGYLAGAAVSKPVLRYPPRISLSIACLATGLCFLTLFNTTSFTVALIAILLGGIPGSMISVIVQHTIQSYTPSILLGRASAAFSTSDAAALLVGSLAAAYLSTMVNLTVLLNIFSLAVLSAGLFARLIIPGQVRADCISS